MRLKTTLPDDKVVTIIIKPVFEVIGIDPARIDYSL